MNKKARVHRLDQLKPDSQPKSLRVLCDREPVGVLATTSDDLVAFEYDDHWLANGFSLNPLSLPLEKRVFLPKLMPFEGLFGVFDDSLPDGWGRLLLDRLLLQKAIDPQTVTPLTRLAIIGTSGMGALEYQPEINWQSSTPFQDLDALSAACANLLKTEYSKDLDELFALGGSSGGVRPKILTTYRDEDWIIKFPASMDSLDAGKREYQYALAAKDCGIKLPEVKLFASKTSAGYFGVKRFDRIFSADDNQIRKVHTASISALLETSHRIPNLDYSTLMQLTLKLTGSYLQLEKLYRLMCFNVFAHNQDDHSRNFSFIYDTIAAHWILSPAYDLTYSSGMHGEHATTVQDKGRDITLADLVTLGEKTGLSKTKCQSIAQDIQERTQVLKIRD